MDLLLGMVMIFTYLTTPHQIQIRTLALAIPTGHRVGTVLAVPLHIHSSREEVTITFNRMK